MLDLAPSRCVVQTAAIIAVWLGLVPRGARAEGEGSTHGPRPGVRTHDGFFFRFGIGPGMLRDSVSYAHADPDMADVARVVAATEAVQLGIGYAFVPGLVFGAG